MPGSGRHQGFGPHFPERAKIRVSFISSYFFYPPASFLPLFFISIAPDNQIAIKKGQTQPTAPKCPDFAPGKNKHCLPARSSINQEPSTDSLAIFLARNSSIESLCVVYYYVLNSKLGCVDKRRSRKRPREGDVLCERRRRKLTVSENG
ncbi:hypothetical protein CEXT_75131 [Caerostris extrusa]|uniref:Uncharacterized protein n=1 Tax=Caerostris extrusa TaxID=172846 RepID=A0AAV4MWA1_CAEEX|nr:hypothetical protein CEXT_75131 [Caerostris extrusa]